MTKTMNCPKCGSDKYYYVQRRREYWIVEEGGDTDIGERLVRVADSVEDDDFEPYLKCKGQCGVKVTGKNVTAEESWIVRNREEDAAAELAAHP